MKITQNARRAWKITLDYTNMTDLALGDEGISLKELHKRKKQAQAAHAYLKENRGKAELSLGWTELPFCQAESVKEMLRLARDVRKRCDFFVVLGIGGSALGASTIFNALCHLHHNELKKAERKAPKFYVEDNVDPARMRALFEIIDLEKTCFFVVSKSGSTSETMAQLLIVSSALQKAGLPFKEHLIFATDKGKGNLERFAKKFGPIDCLYLPEGVGGRFSVLSPAGLFPAAVLGIDVKLLLAGAAFMEKLNKPADLQKNPALMGAVLQKICMERGKNISVLMPYSDHLKCFADWYAQLWAESLGKGKSLDGTPCHAGQTPVKSLGVTDQHSQLQLYAEGPFDKVVCFLSPQAYEDSAPVPNFSTGIPDLDFLCGHSLEELISAENRATAYALTKAKRLNYTVKIPTLNPFVLGELFYFFELVTAYTGYFLNVNAYDQPGVEAGKQAAFALLGKKGFEPLKEELDRSKSDPKYRI